MIKIIKNDQEYEDALQLASKLVALDPAPGTKEGDELELLALLIEKYEDEHFPIELPDAITAISFRMEQQGLVQKDLVPYIGSPSKVSEVLNSKRPLTLKMIRALHNGLGIPAEVLLREKNDLPLMDETGLEWEKFPLVEMIRLRWIKFAGTLAQAKENSEELLRSFLKEAPNSNIVEARCRQAIRSGREMDEYALLVWKAQVLKTAKSRSIASYKKGLVTKTFIRDVVRLSYLDAGPQLVQEYLEKNGIYFVILPHLKKTHLDGASMLDEANNPIIALTLRYDRIDHFWFTLAHELAHIHLHLGKDDNTCFLDDTYDLVEGDSREKQADDLAREAIISESVWHKISEGLSNDNIFARADQLRLHPAILAGRVRWEQNNYKLFAKSVPNQLNREQLLIEAE